ncbi:MAG: hypothetical protein JWM95_3034 [Gemmatimonadetes bacterium]|nr:hypothetical protein [Gemmatimonadota bacterium]
MEKPMADKHASPRDTSRHTGDDRSRPSAQHSTSMTAGNGDRNNSARNDSNADMETQTGGSDKDTADNAGSETS